MVLMQASHQMVFMLPLSPDDIDDLKETQQGATETLEGVDFNGSVNAKDW